MVSQQLRPQFFITRQNGAMVPLIAMDELPVHVQIQNVSRNLSAFEIGGMTGVGLVESRHQFYIVESINNAKPTQACTIGSSANKPVQPLIELAASATGEEMVVEVNEASKQTGGTSTPRSTASDSSVADETNSREATSPATTTSGQPNVQALTTRTPTPLAWRNNTMSAPAPGLNPSLTNKSLPEYDLEPEMPTPGEKIYCAYWLRNGECSFTQTGCLFKHVMPINLQVLEALGHRDLPDWFRKVMGCGSLRVNSGRNGLSFGITPPNIGGMPARTGPRTRLDAEASRRAIAAHINSIPVRSLRYSAARQAHRPNNPRPAVHGSPRIPRVLTDEQRAVERERRDKCLAAAFDADMESNPCTEMTDAEMIKTREREQAGWEAEQKARLTAAAADIGKADEKGEANEVESVRGGERKSAARTGAMSKVKGHGAIRRRMVKGEKQ